MRSEAKLYPLSRAFQQYVARHLHTRKSGWFPTFSGNLTPGLSFGHNLCDKCPNGSYEPVLNICILRTFQWYKELFNPLSFDPCNHFLKIWESTRTLTLQMEVPLEVWRFILSHFLTLLGACGVTPGFPLGLQPYKPLPWSRAQG